MSLEPSALQSESMANVDGYAIIRNAIPQGMAQEAADAIKEGLPVKAKRVKFTKFDDRLPIYVKIRDDFMKVKQSLQSSINFYNSHICSRETIALL